MTPVAATHASILIIDDEPANVSLLERMLERAGYSNVAGTSDPQRGLGLFGELSPDLVLLDLHMPVLDGFAILNAIQQMRDDETYQPVLVLTADITDDAKRRALTHGAMDFVTKPFDVTEVLLRIRNLLTTRLLHVQITEKARSLSSEVAEREHDVHEAHVETARRLTVASEIRDGETGAHIERVGAMSVKLALELAIPLADAEIIGTAARLHDVGKIGVPDRVLLKPGSLTQEEFELMRAHTIIGAGILSSSRAPVLRCASEVALSHHERWDGNGYPRGLARETIPLSGRIVAVADAYDAITNDRRYRRARSAAEALDVITHESARQFDPNVAASLARILR